MVSCNYSSIPSFGFKKACIICGEACAVPPNKKHPDRWKKNPGFLCRRADRGKNKEGNKGKSFKEVLQRSTTVAFYFNALNV